MTSFVRYWLPAIVVVGGILAVALGSDPDARFEGGAAIIGAGLAIWMLNLFYRIGATGDRERDTEEEAREYFDRHGRWPDDEPGDRTQ